MKYLYKEDFKDFEISEFPYDKNHSAIGEYHHFMPKGYTGNWYDPISLHQYRSMDGSWLITSDGINHFLEQNRSDFTSGHFKDVYSILVIKDKVYSSYTFIMNIRTFDYNKDCGMTFNYITSRHYYAVMFNKDKIFLKYKNQDKEIILKECNYCFNDLTTYNIKVLVNNDFKVYVDDKLVIEYQLEIYPSLVGVISKACSRYSDITVTVNDVEEDIHLRLKKEDEEKLTKKQKKYPKLELIKKINIKGFSTGRHIRIGKKEDNSIFFIFAQHQKRVMRDSYARISCLTCCDIDGNILWQKGTPKYSLDSSVISCDLPFQIAYMTKDNIPKLIYSVDFEVIICNALTGEVIKKMPTPLVDENAFTRLNVDCIRVADFTKKGYKSDFIIKDRYSNVWAYDYDFNLLFKYKHKNTGHFPYVCDFFNKGYDELFIGYDYVSNKGEIKWSLPINSDHTDEIIYINTKKDSEKKLYLASGNEGFNIVNLDGSIYKSISVGHAQRISIANYNKKLEGLEICVTSFWGSDGIIYLFDYDGNLLCEKEFIGNGNIITPVNYDGEHVLIFTNSSSKFGGLLDYELDRVVVFDEINQPTLCSEVYDIDSDNIDEILCWDLDYMYIYKAKEYKTNSLSYSKYPDDSFSNYKGEYLYNEDDM